jgi:hypothetical protein
MLAGPSLWSSGQSSWLQIQRTWLDFRHYQIFLKVMGSGTGPLSLVSTTEELLGRKSSGYGLENQEYSRWDSLRWPPDTHYPKNMALTWTTNGGRSVGIVPLRTHAMEFSSVRTKSDTHPTTLKRTHRWGVQLHTTPDGLSKELDTSVKVQAATAFNTWYPHNLQSL